MKAMQRQIVCSSTYRQSAAILEVGLPILDSASSAGSNPKSNIQNPKSIDPTNRLLWHFPRVRLEAEQVRDSLLAVSGLLSTKMCGPSVFPPQPPAITQEGAYGPLAWNVSAGEDRYRRALYTFNKRTAPYAMFATFDGPSGEACTARREASNTPLQALTLLNNSALFEAAQALGRETASGPWTGPLAAARAPSRGDGRRRSPVEERLTDLFRRCLTRLPTAAELAALTHFYETQHQRLLAKELDASAIAGPGDGDLIDRAAWTLMARAILNLDEVITKE